MNPALLLPSPRATERPAPPPAAAGMLFCDWLQPHRDTMFRLALAHARAAWPGDDAAARHAFAAAAVAAQRQRGTRRYVVWLYGLDLLVAQRLQAGGGLPEAGLTGLPPELRAALRLVGHGRWGPADAWALLHQPLHAVRAELLRARLRRASVHRPADHKLH